MVQVPKYSDQGGEVSLPTRRLTPMSGQAIQQLAAPGRALARVGQQASSTAQQYANFEIDQAKKEARMWVVSAEADLREEMGALTEDEQTKTNLDNYYSNESFKDGTNPNTYTNRIKNGFDSIINTETDEADGSKSQRYKAPNQFAEQLWQDKKNQLRSAYSVQAMGYEGEIRSKAKLDKLAKSFEKHNSQVVNKPELIGMSMMSIDALTNVKDDPNTSNIEGGIKAKDLIGVANAAKADLVYHATLGLIRDDPFLAFAILKEGNKPKVTVSIKEGEFKGKGSTRPDLTHPVGKYINLLPADVRLQLTKSAKTAASVVGKRELNDLNLSLSEHIISLNSGGPGVEAFNRLDGVEAAFIGVYGGPHGQIKLEMLPELYEDMKISMSKAKSNIKVARATGSVINGIHEMPTDDVIKLARDVLDYTKSEAVNELSTKNLSGTLFQDVDIKGYTIAERAQLAQSVSGAINAMLTLRSSDFGEYANNNDHIQSIKDPEDKRDAIIAYGENLGISNPNLLTNREAGKIVAQAKNLTNPDMMLQWYNQFNEEYGEHSNRVWSQLSLMEGGLGIEWQLLGAFSQSNAGPMLASGMLADQQVLKDEVSKYGTGFSSSKIDDAVQGTLGELIHTMTGGIAGREEIASEMRELFTGAVLQEIRKAGGKTDPVKAANTVLKTLKESVQFVNNDDVSFYVLPQHVDKNGFKINADIVTENVQDIINNKENLVMTLTSMGVNVPGSMVEEVNRDQAFASGYFADYLVKYGKMVMSDDGQGLMLVYPALAGSDASSTGGGLYIPVELNRKGSDGRPAIVTIPFSELNYARPPGWWSRNTWEWLGGMSEAEIKAAKEQSAAGQSNVMGDQ